MVYDGIPNFTVNREDADNPWNCLVPVFSARATGFSARLREQCHGHKSRGDVSVSRPADCRSSGVVVL